MPSPKKNRVKVELRLIERVCSGLSLHWKFLVRRPNKSLSEPIKQVNSLTIKIQYTPKQFEVILTPI